MAVNGIQCVMNFAGLRPAMIYAAVQGGLMDPDAILTRGDAAVFGNYRFADLIAVDFGDDEILEMLERWRLAKSPQFHGHTDPVAGLPPLLVVSANRSSSWDISLFEPLSEGRSTLVWWHDSFVRMGSIIMAHPAGFVLGIKTNTSASFYYRKVNSVCTRRYVAPRQGNVPATI